MDLEEVYRRIGAETALEHLRVPGIRFVGGRGARHNARFMVVGEAPGATENTSGQPFTGASGRVLTQLLALAGCRLKDEEANTWLTNVVKYRPPGNRTPTLAEVEASKPFLRLEWKAVGAPTVIVAVGSTAMQALGPRLGPITRMAGKRVSMPGGVNLFAMVHPSYGLRNPAYQPVMEKHWEEFGRWAEESGIR